MKLITHIFFSIFILLLFNLLFHVIYIFQIIVLAFVNVLIDVAGHSSYRGPRRTPLTHSPLSATLIGGIWGAVFFYVLPLLGAPTPLLFMLIGGIIAGWTHLFLDSMTYNGIFVFKKRFAIAHFKNGLIDIPFLIVSIVLILYIMGYYAHWP
ncbi:MAG: DUF1286 domain-containing protein [Candidatus Parvarchaeota archaeon]